ncbi:MAG: transposase [Bacteroidales bacterium]|nr:transposase [Bacteroidales bacterium]
MNTYNPQIHHRRTIRMKGYDYSQTGLYFITLCTENRAHLFGEIINGKMVLNDAGHVAMQCWAQIPDHFTNAILHEYVVMPNHVHGIVEFVGANHYSPLRGTSRTIGSVVRGFKIGVTKWMRQNTSINDVWQRNYYEHIIRDESSHLRIADYIISNPTKWVEDKFYK